MKNKLLKHTGAMLLLLACCLTSCIKEEGFTPTDKASVTLTFTTRAPGDNAVDPNLLPGEGMKHLRVIVADQQSGEVRFNYTHEFSGNETSHQVTFGDLYADRTYDFYAIANEQSFGGDFANVENQLGLDGLYATVLSQDANALIGGDNYLPAAAKESMPVKAEANQSLPITMYRPVGKVNLTFKNTTGEDVTLTGVKIPGMAYSGAYLFSQRKLPEGVSASTAGDVTFETEEGNGAVVVPAGTEAAPGTVTIVRYVYPSPDVQNIYELQAYWGEGNLKTAQLKTQDGEEIKGVRRNQMLNMTVTLKSNNGLSLVCEPMPWDGKETDYEISAAGNFELGKPNALIFEYGDNNEKKAYATVYSTEAGAADRQATFTLKMTAPEGVRWTAHLTNALDFEFVEDENHASTGIGAADAQEVTLIVRPTKTYDYSTRRETQLYVTIETNPDQKQIIDKDTSATELSIVQVSTQEGEEIWNKQQP